MDDPVFAATGGDPVEIAGSFTGEIAQRAAEIEAARRFPDDLARRIAATGLYQLCTPRGVGGCGRSPRAYAEVSELLAKADASAGWCTFIAITSSLAIAHLEPAETRSLFANPETICAGVFAPMGRAVRCKQNGVTGFRLTGRWPWGSGVQNSDWVSVGCLVVDSAGDVVCHENGHPDLRSFVVARSDVEIVDTWHVSGMQGTGSTDFQISDTFVPDSHVFVAGMPKFRDPIFTFPMFGFLAIGIAAVALGSAQGALNDVVELVKTKIPQGSRKALADRPSTHKEIALAHGHIQAGRSYFYQAIDDAWDTALSDGKISLDQRREIRHATTHAVHSAVAAVDGMYRLAGGTSVYKSFPLQRRFRDVHVATQHMMVSDSILELVGRLLIGLETNVNQL